MVVMNLSRSRGLLNPMRLRATSASFTLFKLALSMIAGRNATHIGTTKRHGTEPVRSQCSCTGTPSSSESSVSARRHTSGCSGTNAANGHRYPRINDVFSPVSRSIRPPSSLRTSTAALSRTRRSPGGIFHWAAMRCPTSRRSVSTSSGAILLWRTSRSWSRS
jgi:hypothetical protein